MSDAPPAGYLSSAEACRRLGISDRTLRRRVRAGLIDGEYVPRPQGTVLYIRLPPDDTKRHEASADGTETALAALAGKIGEIAEENRGNAGGAETALAALFFERLDAAQTALLAATERAARAEAERDAARQTAEETARRLARAEDDLAQLRRRRWWRWW